LLVKEKVKEDGLGVEVQLRKAAFQRLERAIQQET
jgi:hypothetical protein